MDNQKPKRSVLKILNRTGHAVVEWDAAVETDEGKAAVAAAEALFKEHQGKGATFFTHDGKGNHAPIKEFDPTADEILTVFPIAGG